MGRPTQDACPAPRVTGARHSPAKSPRCCTGATSVKGWRNGTKPVQRGGGEFRDAFNCHLLSLSLTTQFKNCPPPPSLSHHPVNFLMTLSAISQCLLITYVLSVAPPTSPRIESREQGCCLFFPVMPEKRRFDEKETFQRWGGCGA